MMLAWFLHKHLCVSWDRSSRLQRDFKLTTKKRGWQTKSRRPGRNETVGQCCGLGQCVSFSQAGPTVFFIAGFWRCKKARYASSFFPSNASHLRSEPKKRTSRASSQVGRHGRANRLSRFERRATIPPCSRSVPRQSRRRADARPALGPRDRSSNDDAIARRNPAGCPWQCQPV